MNERMTSQVVHHSKPSRTDLTDERSFAGMSTHVSFDHTAPGKLLTADRARESLDTGVSQSVIVQRYWMFELSSTSRTDVRSLVRMSPFVECARASLSESFATHTTWIGTFTSVSVHVGSQHAVRGNTKTTNGTRLSSLI
jgi:hypothetical protein